MNLNVKDRAKQRLRPFVTDGMRRRVNALRPHAGAPTPAPAPAPAAPSVPESEPGPARPRTRRERLRAMGLTELAMELGTDKAGSHHYTQHYERHLRHLKKERFTLFEIGIGVDTAKRKAGASLRMWRTYFPHAQVVGLDIEDRSDLDGKRLRTYQGSQADGDLMRRIVADAGSVEVIIDDGSHRSEHVRESFAVLFPLLAEGGIYVIEDTQTSYWPKWGGSRDRQARDTSMALVKDLVDGLNHAEFRDPEYQPTYSDQHVVGVHTYHNIVFIEKGRNDEGSNLPRKDRPAGA
jgi:hypothetical protein